MNKEKVLIITFKSIQDVLELESITKNGRMIPVPVLKLDVVCVLCLRI